MTETVCIEDVVDELYMIDDISEMTTLFDRKRNKFVYITSEMGAAEKYDSIEEFIEDTHLDKDSAELAWDVLENWKNYISLPSQYQIHEYSMMEDFAYSIDNQRISNILLNAINGRGAFRRFKDSVYRLNMEHLWFDYRDDCYRKIAEEWCRDNNIPFSYKSK